MSPQRWYGLISDVQIHSMTSRKTTASSGWPTSSWSPSSMTWSYSTPCRSSTRKERLVFSSCLMSRRGQFRNTGWRQRAVINSFPSVTASAVCVYSQCLCSHTAQRWVSQVLGGRVTIRACSVAELPSAWLLNRWRPKCRARIFFCFPCCRWPAGCTWRWCASVVTSGRGLPEGTSPWMPPRIRSPRRTGSCAWWVLVPFSSSTWFQNVSCEVMQLSEMEAWPCWLHL